jgi:26S proteasome regulatory subunit N2
VHLTHALHCVSFPSTTHLIFHVAKCIDEYIRQRVEPDQKQHDVPIKDLEKLVNTVFDRSYEMREYKFALGIALEARRLDRIEEAIEKSGQVAEMLNYCFKICMDVVTRDFRQVVLRVLVKLYRELAVPDWIRICEILTFLDDHAGVTDVLEKLLAGTEVSSLSLLSVLS